MWVAVTSKAGSQVGNQGSVYQVRPSHDLTPALNTLGLPTGFSLTATPGTSSVYRNRFYLAGIGSDNAMIDEFYRLGRAGRPAPIEIPTLAAGAGPGPTGSAVVAFAFYDSKDDEWGPLGGSSAAVAIANQSRTTGNVPTTCSDPRMDYVGVWVSMDGASFRLATKRLLGVTSITENVATLALGEAFPTTFTSLPRGSMNAVYHERQFIAGDALHPDVLYASGLLHAERYEGLSFATRNGEPITLLIATRDILLVFTPRSCYGLRGFTEDDMSLDLIDGDIGALGPRAGKLVNGCPVFANDKGIWLYNGAFHLILKDRQKEWADLYAALPARYEAAFAVVDPNLFTFEFIGTSLAPSATQVVVGISDIPELDSAGANTVSWVGSFKDAVPELSGSYGQYDWSWDAMTRSTDCAAFLSLPGAKRGDVYFGGCDGVIRKRDATDDDDDGDAYGKRLFIRTGAMDMGDPGGSDEEGKTFGELWSYVESEANAWTVYAKGGDEQAYQSLYPDNTLTFWKGSIAASAVGNSVLGGNGLYSSYRITAVPKTRHYHNPQRVVGHMLTLEYTVRAPLGFAWRGFGGVYGPGPGSRPAASFVPGGA